MRVDENTMAMHVGRGSYVSLDVARDLGDRVPETRTTISLHGPREVSELDRSGFLGRGR